MRRDVWYSDDGENWLLAGLGGWTKRYANTLVVFDDRMWMIGGISDLAEVYFSYTGTSWQSATLWADWWPRRWHSSVVFENKIWVLGGTCTAGGSYRCNDVWCSEDGVNWSKVTPAAEWTERDGHASVVFNGKIWVLGGQSSVGGLRNDVWFSSDGASWSRATASAGWEPRTRHAAVVFDNKMWVLGGSRKNDVWYSSDGTNWTLATAEAEWSARDYHAATVFDGSIWVLGGYDPNLRNDVWYSSGITGIKDTAALLPHVSDATLHVAPNPLTGGPVTVDYTLPLAGSILVRVFDVQGRSVSHGVFAAAKQGSVTLDLDRLAAGVYMVRLDGDGFGQTHKLVVQR